MNVICFNSSSAVERCYYDNIVIVIIIIILLDHRIKQNNIYKKATKLHVIKIYISIQLLAIDDSWANKDKRGKESRSGNDRGGASGTSGTGPTGWTASCNGTVSFHPDTYQQKWQANTCIEFHTYWKTETWQVVYNKWSNTIGS